MYTSVYASVTADANAARASARILGALISSKFGIGAVVSLTASTSASSARPTASSASAGSLAMTCVCALPPAPPPPPLCCWYSDMSSRISARPAECNTRVDSSSAAFLVSAAILLVSFSTSDVARGNGVNTCATACAQLIEYASFAHLFACAVGNGASSVPVAATASRTSAVDASASAPSAPRAPSSNVDDSAVSNSAALFAASVTAAGAASVSVGTGGDALSASASFCIIDSNVIFAEEPHSSIVAASPASAPIIFTITPR
eukprot:31017-Pelagococcus_subviridis.AAC.6